MNKSPLALLSLSLLLGITACSSNPSPEKLEKDTSYQATLDYKNNLIIKPLTEYLPSQKKIDTYNVAHSILLNACLQKEGYSYPRYHPDTSVEGSREYGMWNPDYTQEYGFGITPEYLQKIQTEHEQFEGVPPEKIQSCYEENKSALDEIAPSDSKDQNSIAQRIKIQAYNAANADPEWVKAKEEWWTCLRTHGLTPQKENGGWGSQEQERNMTEGDQASEGVQKENIRIATIQAECSQTTGMAQTLANLEAAYQGPLIKKNQIALNNEKEESASKNKKAEEIIAKNQ